MRDISVLCCASFLLLARVWAAPTAVADSVAMHSGGKARIAVLANDTGLGTSQTITIVQAPASGSAVPVTGGRVLYSQTTGVPTTDSFTYRVTDSGGTSNTATVSIAFSSNLRIPTAAFSMPATPPAQSVELVQVMSGLSSPVAIASPPGDQRRLFICQKGGLLRLVPDITVASPAASTFLNLTTVFTNRGLGETINTNSEQGLLSVAFHPAYATNRQFYIFYSVRIGSTVYERVSMFLRSTSDPNLADTGSEKILIQQVDTADNHNGGDLHFGPDGYLYISLGDGGDQNDSQDNSQTITKSFFSAIARIDVDKKAGSLAPNPHTSIPTDSGVARYAVPPDNPFVGATSFIGTAVNPANVRTEFWAVGFRNPWRFSFDSLTGELWVGDVGQGAREEIDVVVKGGNYGWAFREGFINGHKQAQAPANFDTLYHKPPVYDYLRSGVADFIGTSVTGGVVSRGARFSAFYGAYIFADYNSGKIWSLVRNPTGPPTVIRLAEKAGISAFGTDPSNGDVLLVDLNGQLRRLTTSTPAGPGTFPQTLTDTGLFADLTDLSPSPGLLPYTPNLPFWSDHAIKSRWFAIPGSSAAMTWSRDGNWTFPNGQLWVKHFDLELTRGDPLTKKRIETRVLVKNATGSYGVSYRWNTNGTEANLVADNGEEFDVSVSVNGTPTTQRWRIPSRSECLTCHTPPAGHALSFNTRQLNLSGSINGFSGNQLSVLAAGGYFSNTLESPNLLPRHLRADETSFPVEARVRSYLAVNCAYCHMAGGTATPAAWDGRPELSLEATGLINGNATNNGGSATNKLVIPGDAAHSVVYGRVAVTSGFSRMPPLGSNVLDQSAINLLTEWIGTVLPAQPTYATWRLEKFGSSTSPEGVATADPDGDGVTNMGEFLAGTAPLNGASLIVIQPVQSGNNISVTFNVPPNRSAVVETSSNLSTWTYWDVPGNGGLPQAGGQVTLTGTMANPQQFFRVRIRDN